MTPSVSTEVFRKARKRHDCCECRGGIAPGDTYQFVTGLWDGSWDSFKTCMHCWDARNFYVGDCDSPSFRGGDEGVFSFGGLLDDLMSYAQDASVDCGTGSRFGAYRRAIELRRRSSGVGGGVN